MRAMAVRRLVYGVSMAVIIAAGIWTMRERSTGGTIPVGDDRAQRGLPVISIELPSGRTIRAEVARTPREKRIGMMFRESVPENTGMLFVYSNEGDQQIWMRNTWISLDIIWIDRNGKVTSVASRVPACRDRVPDADVPVRNGRGMYVLEIGAGEADRLEIRSGAALRFTVP
mgnify:FL=1